MGKTLSVHTFNIIQSLETLQQLLNMVYIHPINSSVGNLQKIKCTMKDKTFLVRGEYTTAILQLSCMNLKSFGEIWDVDHKNCLVGTYRSSEVHHNRTRAQHSPHH